jgi:hypothetical protein
MSPKERAEYCKLELKIKEAEEILIRNETKLKNLVRAIDNYKLQIDVICHDGKPEVSLSHTLTEYCNVKRVVFAYHKNEPMKGGV